MDTPEVSSITSVVNQLLEVSPPVALALVLSFVYTFTVINVPALGKVYLDLGIILLAAIIYPQLADPGKVGFAVHSPLAAEVVTGSLIGCAAIAANPPFRRFLAKLGLGVGNGSIPQPQDTQNAPQPSPAPISPPNPPTGG